MPLQVSEAAGLGSSAGNGSSDSPLISKETSPGSLRHRSGHRHRRARRRPPTSGGTSQDDDDDEDEDDEEDEHQRGSGEEDTPEHEMEYCDPCYCYGKCCLDIVASIFCVSLL